MIVKFVLNGMTWGERDVIYERSLIWIHPEVIWFDSNWSLDSFINSCLSREYSQWMALSMECGTFEVPRFMDWHDKKYCYVFVFLFSQYYCDFISLVSYAYPILLDRLFSSRRFVWLVEKESARYFHVCSRVFFSSCPRSSASVCSNSRRRNCASSLRSSRRSSRRAASSWRASAMRRSRVSRVRCSRATLAARDALSGAPSLSGVLLQLLESAELPHALSATGLASPPEHPETASTSWETYLLAFFWRKKWADSWTQFESLKKCPVR